jgi:hypothetical protein
VLFFDAERRDSRSHVSTAPQKARSACRIFTAITAVSSRTEPPQEDDMTETDERQTVADLAEAAGWHRRNADRTDYYVKGGARVQVLWQGTAVISGGSLYHDDNLTAYTRDLSTVQGWLRR